MRIDVYLTENNYFESRKKASDSVKAGSVLVNGKSITKPSFDVCDSDDISIVGETLRYVGRGGLKLEGAIKAFSLDLKDKVCADIGSSTGGFTDCMLQNGAKRVYAVDSGKDQLHVSLRNDSRVVCMEGVNARYLAATDLGERCDFVTMDVSFISQTLLYEAVSSILAEDGIFVSLIKPQFEAGKENLGKNGIVRSESVRAAVCEKVKEKAHEFGLEIIKIIDSPILGGDGNKEYLALFRHGKYNCGEE